VSLLAAWQVRGVRVGVAYSGLAGLWLALAGCGVTEGRLLHAIGDAGAAREEGGARDGSAGTAPAIIAPGEPWQYQLTGRVDPQLHAQLFVIDLFNVSADTIAQLHASGKRAAAYLSAGTLEPYRDDAARFPASAVGRSFEAYPDESWLDVRDDSVRALMAARLDLARDSGFDGVLPTNLTAYLYDSGFDLSAQDEADYSAWLAEQAHQRGLAVGMSGDFTQAGLAQHFDFGVHYGCIARGDCGLLDPFLAQGKPALDVEIEGDLTAMCSRAAELGVNAILKRSDYGAYREVCP
jgi:hypothetical protein